MNQTKKHFESRLKILISKIIFEEIELENLKNTTISSVELNRDSSIATVYVTFPFDEKKSFHQLERKAGFIRSRVAANIDKKYCPYIKFEMDHLLEQINYWENKFREVKENDLSIHQKEELKKKVNNNMATKKTAKKSTAKKATTKKVAKKTTKKKGKK